MPRVIALTLMLALTLPAAAATAAPAAQDRRQTVCTVTINSADEKAAFARHLPASRFRFVELVQPGRPDWLADACRAGVSCDVMVISGHYDGGNTFFSDRDEVRESLGVSELERASCTEACGSLFSHLKEVYLFGCNTLNPTPLALATADDVRTAVRERAARGDGALDLGAFGTVLGESSRERMRQIFDGVPVIYGFPSAAPLGPVAATALERHFATGGATLVGRGRVSAGLLQSFGASGLAATAGATREEAKTRWDVCQFADGRLGDVQVARHVHRLIRRDLSQVGMHLDRIQRIATGLAARAPGEPALAAMLGEIADDFISRIRLLDAARATPEPGARLRLLELARVLGWLTPAEHRAQLVQTFTEYHAREVVGLAEINLACRLNADHSLDGTIAPPRGPGAPAIDDLTHAALRACLGSADDRARMRSALAATQEPLLQLAQAYLRHRPLAGADDLRAVVDAVSRMEPSPAQVRALEALGREDIADREAVERLVQLYAETSWSAVQVAIAGALMRVDRRVLDTTPLARTLVERRLVAPGGEANKIDALIRRLDGS